MTEIDAAEFSAFCSEIWFDSPRELSLENYVSTEGMARSLGASSFLKLADTRDVRYFEIDLAPGIYRAVIASVYPGTKWRDSCLGELTFSSASGSVPVVILEDPFFAKYLKR